jgi:hypothetical protein
MRLEDLSFSGAPLYYSPLALPTNIRLCWKGLPGTYTQAYHENYGRKKFCRIGPRFHNMTSFIRQLTYSINFSVLGSVL